jgi:hypothetical protein
MAYVRVLVSGRGEREMAREMQMEREMERGGRQRYIAEGMEIKR